MLVPCRDCAESGHCDLENEKCRQALLLWAHGGLTSCRLWVEKSWRGIKGVAA
jgi:hypothetical protein